MPVSRPSPKGSTPPTRLGAKILIGLLGQHVSGLLGLAGQAMPSREAESRSSRTLKVGEPLFQDVLHNAVKRACEVPGCGWPRVPQRRTGLLQRDALAACPQRGPEHPRCPVTTTCGSSLPR